MLATYTDAWAIIPEETTGCPFAVKSYAPHLHSMLVTEF